MSTDHNIWTALFADDAKALRAWLAGLGFEEGIVVPGDGDTIFHSEMRWPEGGRVMVSSREGATERFDGVGRTNLYVVCDDPDAVHARAVALGAEITRPLENATDYESRGFSCRDPEGNHWSFGTYAGE
ncbi:conserved hypothetical protein [Nostocoides japonicum T1-X7]|uniref:VOC domain-containing protein n=1 Tax=Nostocoides japonicum T1-X7 TaxID=1194083 RepID=A0A077LXA3_9MICO|nr:VOC family protein [Tetrasphaera japonica]CCH78311.1 conserved hypothetical protein [Tetrasphaera japonica T1-X7]